MTPTKDWIYLDIFSPDRLYLSFSWTTQGLYTKTSLNKNFYRYNASAQRWYALKDIGTGGASTFSFDISYLGYPIAHFTVALGPSVVLIISITVAIAVAVVGVILIVRRRQRRD
ncbi:MAG TPA: hypothetical protein VMV49_13655 [Candidatus Deferrimicrobium sp.]|nr:hypothetical protein [Candidatus Deferrimicrobium sp.]